MLRVVLEVRVAELSKGNTILFKGSESRVNAVGFHWF